MIRAGPSRVAGGSDNETLDRHRPAGQAAAMPPAGQSGSTAPCGRGSSLVSSSFEPIWPKHDLASRLLAEAPELTAYAVERELARGGQGAVFLATDRRTHTRVAIKLLLNGSESDARIRFTREAMPAAALEAPASAPGSCSRFMPGRRVHRDGVRCRPGPEAARRDCRHSRILLDRAHAGRSRQGSAPRP